MITLNQLSKTYNKNSKNCFRALNNINLIINDGEISAIIGESGAGKSTLLHILSCVEDFDGEYFIDDIDVSKLNDNKLSAVRSNKIGVVLQDFALIDDFTVFENVMTPLFFSNNINNKKSAVSKALKAMGIEKLKNKKISQLSGGQKQRVAIARAIVTNPQYIFADEPTGSLDSKTADEIMNVLLQLNNSGITIIIVTHNLELARKCQRIIEINDGMIINDYYTCNN